MAGSVARPASLPDLFPILQRALETTPRSTARAPMQLPARCTRGDRRWTGVVLSLSASGCLFQTHQDMPIDLTLNLLFPLPMGRMVSTRGRVVREHSDSVGIAFTSISPNVSMAVAELVEHRLAAQPAPN